MQKILTSFIVFYQKFLSFDTGLGRMFSLDGACIYSPTCSEYTKQAIQKYGILRGSYLGFRRILRCHQWTQGGHDPLK